MVWKLDRLGRSIRHLIETVGQLQERKVGFRSLQESIDTTTSGGKLVFHVFAALAEFERDIIRERTRAGLDAARARGKKGADLGSWTQKKKTQARTLYNDKANTIAEICRTLRIGRTTLYRYLAEGARMPGSFLNDTERERLRGSPPRSRPRISTGISRSLTATTY